MQIAVETHGSVSTPTVLPDVVARIGIDLNPLDVENASDRTWLETLIWPEHNDRLSRLRAAMTVVADDPPTMLAGDLVDTIDTAIALAPAGATPVVFHSAVLNYISRDERIRFTQRLARHPEVVWISNEGPGVIDGLDTELRPPLNAASPAFFITARNGTEIVGVADPHGSWIRC